MWISIHRTPVRHPEMHWSIILKPLRSCVAFAASLVASSALAADADNGERLAQRWCSSCHVVAANQQAANADAPPFGTIAKTFRFSAEKLSFFLLDPHPKMPNMALTRNEANDLAAYIGRLAK
jgi:mono/diheme cytochrome c family protein